MERIELYRQQVATVGKHYSDLSRDLIHRLEENDRLMQQKLFFETSLPGMSRSVEDVMSRGEHNNASQGEEHMSHNQSPWGRSGVVQSESAGDHDVGVETRDA